MVGFCHRSSRFSDPLRHPAFGHARSTAATSTRGNRLQDRIVIAPTCSSKDTNIRPATNHGFPFLIKSQNTYCNTINHLRKHSQTTLPPFPPHAHARDMSASSTPGSAALLRRQLKQMQTDKDIPGISCGLVNDNNIYEWEVMLMINDDTKYYGGTASPTP